MKRRAPNISAKDVKAILSVIDGWEAPRLTWKALIARIANVLHVTYVRQALARYPEVAQAFSRRQAELAAEPRRKTYSGELQVANDRIQRLVAENKRLHALNDALLERFVTWSYNASLFGLDEQKLDHPIPPAARR